MKKQFSAILMVIILVAQMVTSSFAIPIQATAATNPPVNENLSATTDEVPIETNNDETNPIAADENSAEPIINNNEEQETATPTEPVVDAKKEEAVEVPNEEKEVKEESTEASQTPKMARSVAISSDEEVAIPTSIIDTIDVSVNGKDMTADQLLRAEIGQLVTLKYGLAIPIDTFKQGDYYTIDLPKNFNSDGIDSGTINELGTYIVKNNQIIITFSQEIENENGTLNKDGKEYLQAGIILTSELQANETNELVQSIVVKTIEGEETFTFQFSPRNVNNNLEKTGVIGQTKPDGSLNTSSRNPDAINWTVIFNKNKAVLNNAVFKDTFNTADLELKEGSFKVTELIIGLNGSVTEGADVTADFVKQDGNSWKVKEGSDKAYKVTYTTDILNDAISSYSNSASIKADGLNKTVTKTVNVSRQPFLTKAGIATKTGAQWAVNYNYSTEEIPNAEITDTLGANHVFNQNSLKVYPVTFDANGNSVVSKTAIPESEYTVDYIENKMVIKFVNTVTSAYQLIYTSTLADTTLDANKITSNKVTANGKTATETITNTANSIGKTVSNVNFQDRIATWTIRVNSDNYAMNNAVVTDTFKHANMSYIEGSATVDGQPFTPILNGTTGLTFNLGNLTAEKTITYKTTLDLTTDNNFVNGAKVTWGGKYTATTNATITIPSKIEKNGFKDVSKAWNPALQNYLFNWFVGFNLDLNGVSAGTTIKDTFTSKNMTIVDGSLKIVELNLSNFRAKTPLAILPEEYYEVTEAEDGHSFVVTFKKDLPSNKAYQLMYDTVDSDQVFETNYTNVARSTLFGKNGNEDQFTFNTTLPNGNKGIEKSGAQLGKSRTFDFLVNINKSKSILPNTVITDQLSSADANPQDMKYMLETFKLTEVATNKQIPLMITTNVNQPADSNAYLYFDQVTNTFKVFMPATINQEYALKYSVYFEGDKGVAFNNTAKMNFSGKEESLVTTSTKKVTYVNNSSTAGWGTVIYKDLFVKKVDATTGTALAGAKFELYKTDDTNVYRTATTDENGIAKFTNIRLKDEGTSPYILKEVEAPLHYEISADYKKGKTVQFSKTNSTVELAYEVENEHAACEVTVAFKNANDQSDVNANGTFKVYVEQDGKKVPFEHTSVTFKDGQANIDLKPGEYFLKQEGKIDGYTSADEFTAINVTYDVTGECATEVKIIKLVPVCEVVILNVDQDTQKTIQDGAEFALIQEGKEIATVTSKNGEIVLGQLPSGDYELKQTKAPNGYELKEEIIEFTVDAENCDVVLPKFENEVPKCDITMINKDENGKEITTGSTYDVYQIIDGEKVKVNKNILTATNGEVIIPQLVAGEYELVQISIEGNYDLNAEPVKFTVNPDDCQVVTVVNEFSKCDVTIINKDENGKAITTASTYDVYQIIDGEKVKVNKEVITAKAGEVVIPQLVAGDYELVQLSVDGGYVLHESTVKFTVVKDGCQVVTVINDLAKCDVTVINKDEDGQIIEKGSTYDVYQIVDDEKVKVNKDVLTATNGGLVIPQLVAGEYELVQVSIEGNYDLNAEPVKFTVDPTDCQVVIVVNDFGTCDVTIINKDGDTQESITSGSTYKLYKTNEQGEKVEIVIEGGITANDNGEILLPNLERGDYVLEQVTAPEHYEAAEDIMFTVDSNDCEVKEPIVLENTMTYCTATIVLIDQELAQAISGAQFVIKDNQGTVVVADVTFNEEGKLVTEPLRPGTYTLELVNPVAGYDIAKMTTFVIDEKDCQGTIEVNVVNTPNKCDVTIFNKDTEGNVIVENSTYKVEKINADGTTSVVIEDVKAENGKIILEQLRPGNYQLTQTTTPNGYEAQTEPMKFEVLKDECVAELTTQNTKVVEIPTPTPEVPEVEEGNEVIIPNPEAPGAEPKPAPGVEGDEEVNIPNPEVTIPQVKPGVDYDIVDKETNKVIETVKANEKGELKVTGLPKGTYEIINKEDKTTKEVTIDKNGQVLPQTGESNSLLYSLAGMFALLVGAYAIMRNRRQQA